MKQVLVLGSQGFIGGHLCRYLSKLPNLRVWGADVVNGQGRDFILLDPVVPNFMSLFDGERFDYCVNCTGAASVSDSINDPLRDFRLNTENVLLILEAIRLRSPRTRFLNLSSAAVYGNPKKLPISEDFPMEPTSPYGVHKMMAEQILAEYHRHFGLATCSVRVFSAYGPGLKKQIVWDIYRKSLVQGEVRLSGSGKETRDFVFIEDITVALECILREADFVGEGINLASGEETSIMELAQLVLSALGDSRSAVFDGNTRRGDPLNWRADVAKLRSLGVTSGTTIKQGIAKCAEWLRVIP